MKAKKISRFREPSALWPDCHQRCGARRGFGNRPLSTRGGIYKDLFDFCERIDLKMVPKAAVERLIKAGAFDNLGATRSQWMHLLPRALQAAGDMQDDRRSGQRNFLDVFESATPAAQSRPRCPIYRSGQQRKIENEKEALDFYLSSHPLADTNASLGDFPANRLNRPSRQAASQEVVLGGMLTEIRFLNTKKARNGNTRLCSFASGGFHRPDGMRHVGPTIWRGARTNSSTIASRWSAARSIARRNDRSS